MAFFDFLRRKAPATVKSEGNSNMSSPDPEWRYHQAYREGSAQAKYAASQDPEGRVQPAPTSTPTPEGGTKDTRPEWIRKESARVTEGIAKEGVAQIPQSPGGENKG